MDLQPYDVVILPLIVGIVELAKRAGLPTAYAPLLAVALGVAVGIVYLVPGDPKAGVLYGVVAGLSASGLYSAGAHYIGERGA